MIKVAIVGCGEAGQRHLQSYRTLDNVQVIATADVSARRAREMAQAADAREWTTDYRDLLALEDLDGVSICTPSDTHATLAADAADHQKHVLLEAPIATTIEDADRLIQAARHNNIKLLVVHPAGVHALGQTLKNLTGSGQIGQLVYMRLAWYQNRRWQDGWSDWRTDFSRSGGPIVQWGIQALDLLCTQFDTPVQRIYAQGRSATLDQGAVHDYFQLVIQFQNTASAVCEIGHLPHLTDSEYLDVHLIGTQGAAAFSTPSESTLLTTNGVRFLSTLSHEMTSATSKLMENWVASIEQESELMVSPEHARDLLQLALRSQESLYRQEPIDLVLSDESAHHTAS